MSKQVQPHCKRFTAGRGKGFVTCFRRVSEAAGLNCSCHAAKAEQGELSEISLQNLLLNLPLHAVESMNVVNVIYLDQKIYLGWGGWGDINTNDMIETSL